MMPERGVQEKVTMTAAIVASHARQQAVFGSLLDTPTFLTSIHSFEPFLTMSGLLSVPQQQRPFVSLPSSPRLGAIASSPRLDGVQATRFPSRSLSPQQSQLPLHNNQPPTVYVPARPQIYVRAAIGASYTALIYIILPGAGACPCTLPHAVGRVVCLLGVDKSLAGLCLD